MSWDTVIGLEVHAQLKTKSKLFSGTSTTFGAPANTQTSFIDAGFPGVLPVLNTKAIDMAIQFGLAINAQINNLSYFERKNYFYPDLPKGYQISQFQRPIISNGQLTITLGSAATKTIFIERAHLEEDAGKSLHDTCYGYTGIDLNRAGTPLLEIVTTPCLSSAEEAVQYLKELHQLLRFLGICDGNMQEGSFRCDVNISLKPTGKKNLGTRTELKNLNSFRFIEKAIHYEQKRHQMLLEEGKTILQETRLFCPNTETTQSMRSKENDYDYRYFPDPDLLPICIESKHIKHIKDHMPALPQDIKQTFVQQGLLTEDEIQFLLSNPDNYTFYQTVKNNSLADDKLIINWLKGHLSQALHESHLTINNSPISATLLAELLTHIHKKNITHNIAKQIFSNLWSQDNDIEKLINAQRASKVTDSEALLSLIDEVILEHPKQVNDYLQGKDKLLAFFVGQVMKKTKGQAEPGLLSQLFLERLVK